LASVGSLSLPSCFAWGGRRHRRPWKIEINTFDFPFFPPFPSSSLIRSINGRKRGWPGKWLELMICRKEEPLGLFPLPLSFSLPPYPGERKKKESGFTEKCMKEIILEESQAHFLSFHLYTREPERRPPLFFFFFLGHLRRSRSSNASEPRGPRRSFGQASSNLLRAPLSFFPPPSFFPLFQPRAHEATRTLFR